MPANPRHIAARYALTHGVKALDTLIAGLSSGDTYAMVATAIGQSAHNVKRLAHLLGVRLDGKWSPFAGVQHALTDRMIQTIGELRSRGWSIARIANLYDLPEWIILRLVADIPYARALDPERVADVRRRLADGERGVAIARSLGCSPQTVSAVKWGRVWRDV